MSIHKPDHENIKPQAPKKKRKEPKPPKKISASYLRNSGLYYLQRYASSSGNFRQVMIRKIKRSCAYHKDQEIEECIKHLDETVNEFQELGLLNDDAYGFAMVTSLRRRGFSKAQIIRKLRMKSMSPEQINEYLERFDNENNLDTRETEILTAIKFAQKKRLGPFRKSSAAEDENQKELAKFARAGFSYDLSKEIMEMDKQEAEDTLYHSVL